MKRTKKQLAAYRDARIQNYARRLSPESLAGMLVDLEDSGGHEPEFQYDEEWPGSLERMRVR